MGAADQFLAKWFYIKNKLKKPLNNQGFFDIKKLLLDQYCIVVVSNYFQFLLGQGRD